MPRQWLSQTGPWGGMVPPLERQSLSCPPRRQTAVPSSQTPSPPVLQGWVSGCLWRQNWLFPRHHQPLGPREPQLWDRETERIAEEDRGKEKDIEKQR
jgi:hypothetical protein